MSCVNLPRWGLKLLYSACYSRRGCCVNLPRWGLKLQRIGTNTSLYSGVNLPRWGLKRGLRHFNKRAHISVNLPRWGLKLCSKPSLMDGVLACKFTPLGFETDTEFRLHENESHSVNLPRWGLKQVIARLDGISSRV